MSFIYYSYVGMHYLSIGTIAKDENDYLEEWLDFHRLVGVEHFIIYDNDSKKPLKDSLAHHKDVTVRPAHHTPEKPNAGWMTHQQAFNAAISQFGQTTKWLALIDCDQFLVPLSGLDIRNVLPEYEKYGGLAVNWQTFGSSGYETKPHGGTLENFLYRAPSNFLGTNQHIQVIVRPEVTYPHFWTPHQTGYYPGFFCVNECHEQVGTGCTPKKHRLKLQLNHYFCRSHEEWQRKWERGKADIPGTKHPDLFNIWGSHCTVYDDRAWRIYRHRGCSCTLLGNKPHCSTRDTRAWLEFRGCK